MRRRHTLRHYIVTQGCRYVWQFLKNCVKPLIGRKLYPDERLVFYRRYILHRLGLRPIGAITIVLNETGEGAGSHAFQVMRTISLARASGLAYLHSPFTHIAHPERPMPEWAAAWETVFNLGAGELSLDGRTRGVVNNGYRVSRDLELCFGLRDGRDQLPQQFQALIPEFRRRYYLNKCPRTTDEMTVAVHIRRGDVSAHDCTHMYTNSDKVLRMASEVKSILESQKAPFSIRVYSQGDISDFAELFPLGVEFFLDADPIWTMQELIEADILLVAKGNFSYYAGVISDGIKIYEPYTSESVDDIRQLPNAGIPALPVTWSWSIFSELESWIPCQLDGSIDRAAFEHRLSLFLGTKRKLAAARPHST